MKRIFLRRLLPVFAAVWSITLAAGEDFTAYQQSIPATDLAISMVPVSGGQFLMGSPDSEPRRGPGEGPRHTVRVDDFWMGQFEVSWQQYEAFVYPDEKNTTLAAAEQLQALAIDGVTGATAPYLDMSFGMGKQDYPAVNMTQYAALMYARWLSAKTGRFYRLPTEAEWEYACRAGTATAWSFGDAADKAAQYAVTESNADGRYAKVGSLQPNPWQLYDMHGNVAEWTLDQFDPGFYQGSPAENPWNLPATLYPRAVRGGSWYQPVGDSRCAARLPSEPRWKQRDPQIPRSQWWHTNIPFVGFRLVRPRQQPPAAEVGKYWLEAIEDYGT